MALTESMQVRAVSTGSDPSGRTNETDQFRAGSELREARERLGWDLGEVAAALRIKLAYLQAIEDGRISALPGNAYALGFLRTYATTLGLDPDAITRRFRAEAQDVNRKTALAFPSPVPERGVPTGAMVLLGLVIAIVGYVGWYRLSDHEQTATHTVPAVPEQLLAAPKAAPVSPQVASVMPTPGTPTPTLPPTPAPVPAPAASPTPQSQAIQPQAPQPAQSVPTQAATSQPSAATLAPATTQSATPAQAATGLTLQATAATWVQVRGSDGRVVWDHVMQPGDTWPVPADQTGLTLTTGNAGGLEIISGGASLGSLGRTGAVRRNIVLTADGVKAVASPAPATPTGTSTTATTTTAPAPRPARAHLHIAPPEPDSTADDLNARQLERTH
jgi:cytoskeleton protein RodZ